MYKVNARAILELGSELINYDPIAIYELIKNRIDAICWLLEWQINALKKFDAVSHQEYFTK